MRSTPPLWEILDPPLQLELFNVPVVSQELSTIKYNHYTKEVFFCWTKVYFVGPLIAPILDPPLCDPPHGFQSQGGSLSCTLTCLCAVNPRVTSGATPAFSTNSGVHCISVYTAGPPSRHPSCKQQVAGNGGC